ncbi:MAG: hypothetical protein MUC93_08730 [Bacteroidales bacterium]|nr:hypothetical protein [Bacteroidales bacterium]
MIDISEFNSLSGKRFYFAHQSVGYNIIEGLHGIVLNNKDLSFIKIVTFEEYLKLKVDEDDKSFYFVHSQIGKNEFPELKLDDFQYRIDSLCQIDAALLKFCFVDINRNTDINLRYNTYINRIRDLEEKHDDIKFVFSTVPLTAKDNYIKRLIKTLLGRQDHNRKRNQFNNLIRGTADINIFDIAYLESHHENDTQDLRVEYLLKEYTFDNGHLNKIGSEKVAIHLLIYLNNLFRRK